MNYSVNGWIHQPHSLADFQNNIRILEAHLEARIALAEKLAELAKPFGNIDIEGLKDERGMASVYSQFQAEYTAGDVRKLSVALAAWKAGTE